VGKVIFILPALDIASNNVILKVYEVFALTVEESIVGVVLVIVEETAENVEVPSSFLKLFL